MRGVMSCGRRVVWALGLWAVASAVAQTPAPSQWVQGSWVRVREQPSKNAKVVDHWVANTPVQVTKRTDDGWCEARHEAQRSGWVACEFLGAEPLTLKAMLEPNEKGEMPPSAAARAFWIAPSMGRLVTHANELNYSALSAAQQEQQAKTKKPIRFPIPEYEAMKQRLVAGVLPRLEQELPRLNLATLQRLDGLNDWRVSSELRERLRASPPGPHLPPAKPSLLRAHGDVLLLAESSADTVTALLGQASQVSFHGLPEWVDGHHDSGVWGLWDVMELRVRYARPAVLHTLARNGLLGARHVASTVLRGNSPAAGCTEGDLTLPEGRPLPGFPTVKDGSRLLSFYMPQALAVQKIEIIGRKRQIVGGLRSQEGDKPQSVVVHAIDLNQDGVADIAIIEWPTVGVISDQPQTARDIYLNINGQWWYAATEAYQECT